jgi:Na+-translocating ferredoxin:NAD+ oxidoreductase RNF subunit RnfB
VWEDPRIDIVAQMLPNANCGACGLPGCRAFAEGAVEGRISPSQCTLLEDAPWNTVEAGVPARVPEANR